ncbi:MAG TPA: hemerythrin domain-containing protein [Nanoarchaeota archaeon]|nr:hemerythrin domain-containing protein [Nanoarchaeota archaeon]
MQTIFDFMSADHDRLDGLFKEFQKASHSGPAEAKKLFSEFSFGLKRHIVWEEEILFPLFEERTGMKDGGPTEAMRFEHLQIKSFLKEIDGRISLVQDSTGAEQELLRILGDHNMKEEHILYPSIDESLGEKEIKAVLEKITKTRRSHL